VPVTVNPVDGYLAELEHPLKAEVVRLREIVLGASPAIEERIKWKSPSFFSGADDLGAFELRPRDFVRLVLVFPHGLVDDPEGIMLGDWKDRRELRFTSLDDIEAKRAGLENIVKAWVARLAS
jgi:hypothetical protein